MTQRSSAPALLAALMAWVAPLHAAEFSNPWDGVISVRTDAWTGSRSLDDTGALATASLWAKGKLSLGDDHGTLAFDGWGRGESRDASAYRQQRVRELFWRGKMGPVALKVGRQITAWGRADGLNPTDNLSPRDFTLLAPEDGDLRSGNEAVQLSVEGDRSTVSAWWFPKSASDTIPLQALPMVRYVLQPVRDKRQWAVRWDYFSAGIDASVSYFDGIDHLPDLSFAGADLSGVQILVTNHRVRVLGADLSISHGNQVWRAELAFTHTDSAGPQDFEHKKRSVMMVGGPEWAFADVTVGVQAIAQRVFNFASPNTVADPVLRDIAIRQVALSNQPASSQYGFVARVAARWLGDNLLTELSAIGLGSGRNGIVRSKLDYALGDHWHVQGGTEHYFGERQTFFGQLKANQMAYVQVRRTF